ncbi:hypothetical protein DY000_02041866 [Brassica cretica]|uniref:Uncharacterized protein n=1 Tax=Brassica cretica TaxID=69181 RepID=A0ABQ7B5M8_BRACR|nr:hypothetical protein DY000_02041866 [Brassica cretica]
MSEQENHNGRWISTSAASETKAPHSSDYAHYPRLNPSDITPPMHAPISGVTATICSLSSSLTVLLPLPPRVSYLTFLSLKCRNGNDLRDKISKKTPELDFKRMWSGNCWSTKHLLSFNGGRMNTAPKDDAKDDSSADEEQPTNRRRIEVILSQQTLSSDDENDDAPAPGDMRDVLKRKLEPEDGNSSDDTDLRLTLNAQKSQLVLTSGPVLKERPKCSGSNLRDKLNANMCDLRVLLNRSKPTDLRR